MKAKEKFRSPLEFVQAGADNPPSTPIADEPAPEPHTPAVTEAEQGGAEPDNAPTPQEATPARQKAAKSPVWYPWHDAHPKLKEQFTMRLPQALHMKLKYVAEHSPESMHDIALAAVSAAVDKRLRDMDIKG